MWRAIPLVAHLAAASPLLPVVLLLVRGVRTAAHRWILVACLLSVFGDGAGLYMALRGINNQWISYTVTPLMSSAMLLALAHWQPTHAERAGVRLITGLLLVVSVILVRLVENVANFSQYAIPLGSLLIFAAAVWTLVRGGWVADRGAIAQYDWFWSTVGFALYAMVTAAYFPLLAVLAASDPAFVGAVLKLKSLMVVLAFGLVGWG